MPTGKKQATRTFTSMDMRESGSLTYNSEIGFDTYMVLHEANRCHMKIIIKGSLTKIKKY